jgi:hypothetical protein
LSINTSFEKGGSRRASLGWASGVQHLAESAVDTAKTAVETAKTAINTGKEIATATAKKIKNAVS